MATVLTMGTFDVGHQGHFYLFEQCWKIAGKGGRVVVGLNRDEFVAEFKGKPPVQSYTERYALLNGCRWVDTIHPTPGSDAKPLIEVIDPDFLVIGSDWAFKDYYAQLQITQQWLRDHDIALLYLDRLGDLSSTRLKARIREQS